MYKRGENHPQAKMTEARARDIKRLLAMGYPQKTIATMLDVSYSSVRHINKGRTWRHLEDST